MKVRAEMSKLDIGLRNTEYSNRGNKINLEGIVLSEKDNINPSHYQKYPLQMIDNMQNSMTPDEFKGYLKGNIMKYISRYQDKNGVEDLKKADWYLNKLIEVETDK